MDSIINAICFGIDLIDIMNFSLILNCVNAGKAVYKILKQRLNKGGS